MTRAEWIEAIRLNPVCETTRLTFADWLDDYGAGDLDAATAEFVRASCRGVEVNGTQMARPAYAWLEANWPRLVPTLYTNYGTAFAATQQPAAAETLKMLNWRSGRKIGTTVHAPRTFPKGYPNVDPGLHPFSRDYFTMRA